LLARPSVSTSTALSGVRFAALKRSAAAGDLDRPACIGARSTETEVPAGSAVQPVIAGVPRQFVRSGLAEQAIVRGATGKLILPAAGEDSVSSASTGNLIVPWSSTDDVVTATPLNLVVAAASDDHVASRRTPNLVRASRANDRCIQPCALWLKGCLRAGRSREGGRQDNHRSGCGNRRDDAKSTLPGHTFPPWSPLACPVPLPRPTKRETQRWLVQGRPRSASGE
jgi:hypothetical protein